MSVFWLTTSTSGRLHLVRCQTCLRSTVVSSLREVVTWQYAHDVHLCVDAVRARRRLRSARAARSGALRRKPSTSAPAPRSFVRSPFSNQEETP